MHFADRTGLDVVFARIAFVYGPLYHSFTNAPSRIAHSAVRGVPDAQKTKPFAGDHYDYIYVGDCAEALFKLQTATDADRTHLQHRRRHGGAVTGRCSKRPAAVIPNADFAFADGQDPFHKPTSYLDIERFARDTGFRPKHDITSGMAAYIAWLREHEV